jgi:hypothetical protein
MNLLTNCTIYLVIYYFIFIGHFPLVFQDGSFFSFIIVFIEWHFYEVLYWLTINITPELYLMIMGFMAHRSE